MALPEIPDKLYFRIGEVAGLLDLPAYVLRFWESEFPQLKPNKGGTGQRLYRRRDVETLLEIRRLLYDEGYTIPGARQYLKDRVRSAEPTLPLETASGTATAWQTAKLLRLQKDLRELSGMLGQPLSARRPNPAHRGLHIPHRREPDLKTPPPLFSINLTEE